MYFLSCAVVGQRYSINGFKILVSVVRFRPRAPFYKTISMAYFSQTNAMRVPFKNTPNTHFFSVFECLDSGVEHCVSNLVKKHSQLMHQF